MKIDLWKVLVFVCIIAAVQWLFMTGKKKPRVSGKVRPPEEKVKTVPKKQLSNADRGIPSSNTRERMEIRFPEIERKLSMECEKCGAALEISPENLLAYCPYCGNKLLIDVERFGAVVLERERIKREQERTKQEKERTEQIKLIHRHELEKTRLNAELKEQAERKECRRKFWASENGSALAIFAVLLIGIIVFVFVVSITN